MTNPISNLFDNIILLTDSYKATHYLQYPPKSRFVISYYESRGGKFKEVVFFGLQYFLKRYLVGQVVTAEKIDEAEDYLKEHMPDAVFNRQGWEYILNKHNGRLPISIKAQPEGMVTPNSNVMMIVENTDPACYWLTNYLETLLVQVWHACTVATQSREMKKVILKYLKETGNPKEIDFKLHDFGFRGVSSVETAGIGGSAHLVNFLGTDNIPSLIVARRCYNERMAGFSINAAEHSTITSWGREHEVDAYRNMLTSYPTGLVAVVSDSYNIFNACENIWGKELKSMVLNREGVLVVRPDSGHPPEVVVKCLEILGKQFGTTENEKGYKVLDPHVRIIQGDGIDFDMLGNILEEMKKNKFSADNIAFGSGGGLLQKMDRDTLKFAFKCSSINVDGEERDVYKDPITDQGKQSKRGKLKLIKKDDNFETTTIDVPGEDLLKEVFKDGEIVKEYNFSEIRELASL